MSVQEWGIVVGAIVAGMLALGPWMFMVHAKLAVIGEQIEDLSERIEKTLTGNGGPSIPARCHVHDAQIERLAEEFAELRKACSG